MSGLEETMTGDSNETPNPDPGWKCARLKPESQKFLNRLSQLGILMLFIMRHKDVTFLSYY